MSDVKLVARVFADAVWSDAWAEASRNLSGRAQRAPAPPGAIANALRATGAHWYKAAVRLRPTVARCGSASERGRALASFWMGKSGGDCFDVFHRVNRSQDLWISLGRWGDIDQVTLSPMSAHDKQRPLSLRRGR